MNTLIIKIKEDKYLSTNVRHTKVYIDNNLYKRIEYIIKNKPFCVQWMENNKYLDNKFEKKIEYKYQKYKPR